MIHNNEHNNQMLDLKNVIVKQLLMSLSIKQQPMTLNMDLMAVLDVDLSVKCTTKKFIEH